MLHIAGLGLESILTKDGTQAVSGIIYLNGSTDYIEAYGFSNGGSTVTLVGDISNFSSHFSATWVHD